MSAKLKPTKNPTGEVLTLAEAAAFLRVEAEELRRAADAGRVPGRAIGAEWRFVKATLVEWLSQPETRSGPARTNRELADHRPHPGERHERDVRGTGRVSPPVAGDPQVVGESGRPQRGWRMINLLDTDIFTLAHQNRFEVVERIASVTDPDEVAIGVITRVEVLAGRLNAVKVAATAADVLRMQARLAESEAFLAPFRVVAFDPTAGEHFGRLAASKKLKKIGRGDLLNASVALAHGATLVTRNTKDFSGIPGLKLENWAD